MVACGLVLSLPSKAVLADDNSGDTNLKVRLQEKRKEIEQKVQESKTDLKAKAGAVGKKLETAQARMVGMYIKRMASHFDAAINRLDNLASRIDSRLTKLASDKKDVTAYKKSLADAKTKIDTAKSKLAEAKTVLDMVSGSENPKDDFAAAKAKLSEVKTDVQLAQKALSDVVSSVKGQPDKQK